MISLGDQLDAPWIDALKRKKREGEKSKAVTVGPGSSTHGLVHVKEITEWMLMQDTIRHKELVTFEISV